MPSFPQIPSSIRHTLFHSDDVMAKTINEEYTVLIILLVFLDPADIIEVRWEDYPELSRLT